MSPATLSTQNILQTISEETFGFKFGKPDRPSEKSLACILPILRETSQVRQYTTMPETEELLVTDSGTIYKVNLKNASKENVFVRSGTIFEGKGTQSRALTRSAVIFPGKEVGLDVRCVHQSHGISNKAKFEYGGITPFSVESANYTAGYRPRDQSAMWDSVRAYTSSCIVGEGSRPESFVPPPTAARRMQSTGHRVRSGGIHDSGRLTSSSPFGSSCFVSGSGVSLDMNERDNPMVGSDNLKASFDEFAKGFDDLLSKARLHDNQAGLALITDTGCKTVECFDVPISWEALHKDAVKRMGTELLRGPDNTSVFEYKPENAVAAVRKVLALPFKSNLIYAHKPSNGEPAVEIFGLTAGAYVGEVVELDGRVIHLLIIETVAA